jgi:hypothetical protein
MVCLNTSLFAVKKNQATQENGQRLSYNIYIHTLAHAHIWAHVRLLMSQPREKQKEKKETTATTIDTRLKKKL